ncbi:MAG: hypothetical protein OXP09_10965 [Gammaproteobacteria bacterium]|nr:hypothetical protein [Gammaproteobacteria bacterium]MDE0366079.1 hypothetical protein [Gammaproteobacteria bacterium]
MNNYGREYAHRAHKGRGLFVEGILGELVDGPSVGHRTQGQAHLIVFLLNSAGRFAAALSAAQNGRHAEYHRGIGARFRLRGVCAVLDIGHHIAHMYFSIVGIEE